MTTTELCNMEKVERVVGFREVATLTAAADEEEKLARTLSGRDRYLLYDNSVSLRERAELLEAAYRGN
jgi:hypothetical protein